MSFDDWVLALHVLSAFSLVAGLVFFWVLIVALRGIDTPAGTLALGPHARLANAAIGVGMGGTILLGIWLAFSVGGYDIWDLWIVAAIVLWVVTARVGQMVSAAHAVGVRKAIELRNAGRLEPSAELLELNRTRNGLLLQALASALVLLILIDMIWKPGA